MSERWSPDKSDEDYRDYLNRRAYEIYVLGDTLKPHEMGGQIRDAWERSQMKKGGGEVQGVTKEYVGPPTPPHLLPPIDPMSNWGQDVGGMIKHDQWMGNQTPPEYVVPYARGVQDYMLNALGPFTAGRKITLPKVAKRDDDKKQSRR